MGLFRYIHTSFIPHSKRKNNLEQLKRFVKDTETAFGPTLSVEKYRKYTKKVENHKEEMIEKATKSVSAVCSDDSKDGQDRSTSSVKPYSNFENKRISIFKKTTNLGGNIPKPIKSKNDTVRDAETPASFSNSKSDKYLNNLENSSVKRGYHENINSTQKGPYDESQETVNGFPILHPTELPLEPPPSFDIIRKLSLVPDQVRQAQTALTDFQKDVSCMNLRAIPSVKSVLSKTAPEINKLLLKRWREKMIKELGEDGFKLHQETTIKRGVNLHANVLEYLSGKAVADIQIMPDNQGHWESLKNALADVDRTQLLEESVCHAFGAYRGVVDCLAFYRDTLSVIDWKTSKKPKPLLKNTYDDPAQIAAYIGAINSSPEIREKIGTVEQGILVVCYPDGSPGHIHKLDRQVCEDYWQDWCERLYQFYVLSYTQELSKRLHS